MSIADSNNPFPQFDVNNIYAKVSQSHGKSKTIDHIEIGQGDKFANFARKLFKKKGETLYFGIEAIKYWAQRADQVQDSSKTFEYDYGNNGELLEKFLRSELTKLSKQSVQTKVQGKKVDFTNLGLQAQDVPNTADSDSGPGAINKQLPRKQDIPESETPPEDPFEPGSPKPSALKKPPQQLIQRSPNLGPNMTVDDEGNPVEFREL